MIDRTADGNAFKIPNIIGEYTRENEYIESFNGELRDELLNKEIFITL